MNFEELWRVADALADAAREETLKLFRAPDLIAESKTDDYDPVTAADRAAETAMRAVLAELRPEDAILAEEFDNTSGTSGLTWVLDPIDGTRGYVAGTPTWGTLIALSRSGEPILGLIDQPYIGERFRGGGGVAGMTGPLGARPMQTRTTRRLEDAVLFTTFPEVGTDKERAGFADVAGRVKLVRFGMDCYAYALLAAGQIDLVIEAGLQAYDIQAPIAVIEAAGGVVTDWQGGSAAAGGRAVAAANAELHALALDILSRYAE